MAYVLDLQALPTALADDCSCFSLISSTIRT